MQSFVGLRGVGLREGDTTATGDARKVFERFSSSSALMVSTDVTLIRRGEEGDT